jgi:hypothetical protein
MLYANNIGVNSNGAISDQKMSKFFVSHMEGHMGANVGCQKLEIGFTKGSMVGTGWSRKQRGCVPLFQVLLKLMLT